MPKASDSSADATANNLTPENEPKNFETALAELETLVTSMESGELTLDESLKAFERGVKLARRCQTELKHAEQKVQILNADGALEDFDLSDGD
ncbi:MAG: exodeoxyribonuclease VII small subunit [Pseudomonadales bacterium]|nr:exodeoxyribonuclease VII small subunit [Pseudomonadales bacterium]